MSPPNKDFIHETLGDQDPGVFEPFADADRFGEPPPNGPNDYGFNGKERDDAPFGETGGDHTAELDVHDAGDDTEPPPPRRWLAANQFCRRFLSGLLGPGATGKTALRVLQYLSLATGRPLAGQHIFRRCRVLMLSFE